jgi:phospholipid transport system substrate-binding protein
MIRVQPRWLAVPTAAIALTLSVLGLMLSILGTTSAATADDRAETFVSERANAALQILGDDSVPLDQKKARFRTLVEDVADVPRITRFVLGRYAREIGETELDEFSTVFSEYAIGVYESRLGDYAGETLAVTGSTDRRPGDTVVHTEVSGGSQAEPLPVNWRVLTDDAGQAKVVDVEVYGVWLAINQRDEITTIINNNAGKVDAATEALRSKIAQRDFAGG